MIRVSETDEGIIISVRAKPGSKCTEVLGEYDGALRIALAAAPEKGKANKALIKFLAKQFGVTQKDIEIIGGETSRDKRALIRTDDKEFIQKKLSEWGTGCEN